MRAKHPTIETAMTDKDKSFIIRTVTCTACFVVVSMVLVMLAGLFDPIVDNAEIFKVVGPAFSTLIGCFVGVLGTLSVGKLPNTPDRQ